MANWKEMLIKVFKETGDDFEKMEKVNWKD